MLGRLIASFAVAGIGWRIYCVRKVRYDRLKQCDIQYGHLLEKPEEMTYDIAGEIMKVSHYWDMPWSLTLALSLALFNTYAIPTISSVLVKTGELADPSLASKRAEDTAIFIAEFLSQGLDSERGSVSLARMNWLHSRWGKQIKQGDLLYTLSLFIFEPITFAEKYEWRSLTELEQQARFVFWTEVGARMGIEDIPKTRKDLWNWKEQYATENMVYAKSNDQVGALTMAILVAPIPSVLKGFGQEAGKVFIEPRIIRAFGWQRAAPAFLHWLVPLMMRTRALIIAYLAFPRVQIPTFLTSQEVTYVAPDGKTSKCIQRDGFVFEPWYVPGGKSMVGQLGLGKPGDKDKWQSSGWQSESLGPDKLRSQGLSIAVEEGRQMREAARLCPFFR